MLTMRAKKSESSSTLVESLPTTIEKKEEKLILLPSKFLSENDPKCRPGSSITNYATITSLKELVSEGVGTTELNLSLASALSKVEEQQRKVFKHHLYFFINEVFEKKRNKRVKNKKSYKKKFI